MTEIWRDIKGYEGLYQVSNFGNIRNAKGRRLKQTYRGNYLKIGLSKNGHTRQISVHRIVAETFVDNPNNYPIVNHIDEDKVNNKADNLEWCTRSYNTLYNGAAKKAAIGRRKPVIATNVLTGEKTLFHSIAQAEELGIATHSHIIGCLKGHDRRKSTGGYTWSYA